MLWHNRFFNEVRQGPEDHPRMVKERLTISEEPAHTKYSFPAYQDHLTARERKHTFDHSTMFYPEGPCPQSVYDKKIQQATYEKVAPTFKKNAQFVPAKISTLTPSEMLQTHNHGHRLVDTIGDDKSLRVYPAQENDTIIKEVWNTSTNVLWNDPRIEVGRSIGAKQRNATLDAKGHKSHEMSSELFGYNRGVPAVEPLKEQRISMIPTNMNTFGTDSLLTAKKKPNPVEHIVSPRASKISQLTGKMAATMAHGREDPMGLDSYDPGRYESTSFVTQRDLVPVNTVPKQEKPKVADRRKTEKNYSDMNDLPLPPTTSRAEAKRLLKSQRDLDWLHSSVKSASNMNRNRNATPKWDGLKVGSSSYAGSTMGDDAQSQRRMSTRSARPAVPRPRTSDKAVWGLSEPFSPHVELNRYLQTGVYASRKTPKQRKQESLSSSIFSHLKEDNLVEPYGANTETSSVCGY
eukprot:Platyproteum_vivax@DN3562_c0_g1_i1.p1